MQSFLKVPKMLEPCRLLRWYFVGSGGLTWVMKSEKIKGCGAGFTGLGGLLAIIRRGCGLFGGEKLMVCDL